MRTKTAVFAIIVMLALAVNLNLNARPPVTKAAEPSTKILRVATSEAALRNYAMAIAKYGEINASTNWMHGSVGASAFGECGELILEELAAVDLSARIQTTLNPEVETEEEACLLNNSDSWGSSLLFYGRRQYKANAVVKPSFEELYMLNIPVLDGIKTAKVLVLDASGETIGFAPNLAEVTEWGELRINPKLAGAINVRLEVTGLDGSTASYILFDPAIRQNIKEATVYAASIAPDGQSAENTDVPATGIAVENHYTYKAPMEKGEWRFEVKAFNKPPSLFFQVPIDGAITLDVSVVYHDAAGVLRQEKPYAMSLTVPSGATTRPFFTPAGQKKIQLPPGNYRVDTFLGGLDQPRILDWYPGLYGD